ncbi:hypothetical protein [uncultured Bilophila sp.]|uniref:hypothetical protein n=1 Tax=uncultured Bilophila sp. TaxID=529385 RepID=UPI00261C7885|nr:hypothetical protein [uncultured Bilophila sp.]
MNLSRDAFPRPQRSGDCAATLWFLLGYDFNFTLSIDIAPLVIPCPCAFGLDAPDPMGGHRVRGGILFKSGPS